MLQYDGPWMYNEDINNDTGPYTYTRPYFHVVR